MTTIKIDREQLIATLTAKVKELEANNATHEKEDKAWRAALAKWEQTCATIALKNIKKASISVNTWRSEQSVGISLPAGILPEQPEQSYSARFTHDYELRDLRQFIRMLELSSSDTIAMSALKNVSQYL
jgi:hypothetical protein